jgi:hypothetical protein
MNDYRAAGQELQSQVMAAARKGQERMNSTVKTVRAAADQIRPQLANLPIPSFPKASFPKANLPKANLPRPTLSISSLPSPAQLRERAEELAGHARSVRRVVIGQVAGVAAPLAQQAATRLAQIGEPTAKASTGKTSTAKASTGKVSTAKASTGTSSSASKTSPAARPATGTKRTTASKPAATAKSAPAASTGTTTKVSKVTVSSDPKPEGAAKSTSSSKPKAKPADK